MAKDERVKKLQTLPWQALYDFAIEIGVEDREIKNKDKDTVIEKILYNGGFEESDIDQLVNDYIYGNRITFTLWLFSHSLSSENHKTIYSLENTTVKSLGIDGFQNLKIISVKNCTDRIEILYVYSKEYSYINEDGHNDSIWEQHRGCLWIGIDVSYAACISKHDKMTTYMIKLIAQALKTNLSQIKPPKTAMERCINPTAISRIVLQGLQGEKTIVSKPGGITEDQEKEIERIKPERIDTSGSYITNVDDNTEATIKYNLNKGSLGIYKHLPANVLFSWTHQAIEIILEEIDNLKGKPAEIIFKEVGQELKWSNLNLKEEKAMNWFLTQVISSKNHEEDYSIALSEEAREILKKKDLFLQVPRIYCNECDSYEIPLCNNCNKPLRLNQNSILSCDCEAPLIIKCQENHSNYKLASWYIPQRKFYLLLDKNIKKIYPDEDMKSIICIMDNQLYIIKGYEDNPQIEIAFHDVKCFSMYKDGYTPIDSIRNFAVKMNEKCSGTCSKSKIEECLKNSEMVCLPKVFYSIIPSFRPQPHKGGEFGDVSGQIQVGNKYYEMIGIIKKNTENKGKNKDTADMIKSYLLSTSKEGEEIIRQFVQQGMIDARCEVIAIIAPQYFDAGLKGTIHHLAKLAKKKVIFIELDEVCQLIEANDHITGY